MQLEAGSYRINKKYASDVRGEPFWATLASNGHRVFSFDVAQTRPIEDFNGINLCGWGSEYPAWPRSSWPKPLMKELVARYGSHPLVNSYRLSISPGTENEYRLFYNRLSTGLQRKGEICLDILGRERWDLALVVFPEVHWAMHLLWQTWDRDHPDHDPDIALPFDNVYLDLYRKLDTWIGRFRALMPGADVLVFSGSGLGPNYSGWHLLPEVLEKIGLGPPPDSRRGGGQARALLPMRRWGASKIRKTEDTLSVGTIEFLKKVVPAPIWDRMTRRLLHAGNRWAASKAFALPNDYSGAIRINLAGRERHGVVPPEEYDAVCSRIERALRQLVNPDTGRPVVQDVIRLRAVYPGEDLGDFPDLIVTWANDAPVNAVESPAVGMVSRPFPERRSGAHRNDCFILSSRVLKEGTESGASLLDLAPTIFDLLGAPPASRFDGRSLLA
jgi:predicted AlkP superfamily phosphohydrolase/phosphomutase